MNVQKCQRAADAYKRLTIMALKELNLDNVSMYMDAGHGGWLGWNANLDPAVKLFTQIFNQAGKPKRLRGLATNVANYNAWNSTSCPSYTKGNDICNEEKYVNRLGPLLKTAGFDAHFIMDTCKWLSPYSLSQAVAYADFII
jgi:cellulose 1,4-beta-cellobiosidase